MKAVLGVIGALVIVGFMLGSWVLGSYNTMIAQDAQVQNAWGQVETQYQRRFDLIPNLVGSVQGILTQEQKVFGDIAEARTRYANAKEGGTQEEQVEAYGQYESVIGRLLIVMENYPELRSYAQVQALMDELAGTENRVLVVRDRYNTAVTDWNVSIKRFPRNVLAGMFGFEEKKLFEAQDGADQAPSVKLNQ